MEFRNKEGSTGRLKGSEFTPFASQADADKDFQPEQEAEEAEAPKPPRKPAPKAD